MAEYSIGVDIGGTNLRAAAVAADGVMLEKISGTTDLHEGREAVIQDIIDSIHRLKEKRGADTLAGRRDRRAGIHSHGRGQDHRLQQPARIRELPDARRYRAKTGNADFPRERRECGRSGREMDGRGAGRAGSRLAHARDRHRRRHHFRTARCFMDSSEWLPNSGT